MVAVLTLGITFSNATTTDVFIAGADPEFNGFFGVMSNGPSITSLKLNGASFVGTGESFSFDNLRYGGTPTGGGGTPTVPEPSSLVLLGSAIGTVLLLKSRLA
jgi:hypothetical protein